MPTTIADLRTRAALIADATQVGENTANRVGTAFDMVADLLDGLQGITNVSTIDIGDLDTLKTLDDMKSSTPNIYTITKTIGANTFKLGTLFQFANNGRYDVAQVIVSQFIPDAMGDITTTSADGEVHIYYRICRTQNQGHLPTPVGTWTTWTEIGSGGGGGITIDGYPTEDSTNAVSSGGVFERLQEVAPTIDYAHLDDIDDYADMLAGVSPFYMVTKHIGSNDFRIGTLMEFANQGRYILYQILATDFDLDDDGVLDTNVSINGGLKFIWRMKQFSGVPPQDVTLNVWSRWWYLSGGGGGSITIDPTPTSGSQNAVSSGGVYDALALKQNTLTFDNAPTNGSNNPVKSGGVYTALQGKQNTLTFDDSPSYNSNNPVKSGGVFNALEGKVNKTGNETISGNKTFNGSIIVNDLAQIQEGNVEMTDVLDDRYELKLTFDNTPTDSSNNPVKSGGIYDFIVNALSAYVPATQFATINGSIITQGGNVQLVVPQGTITIDAAPTSGSQNAVSSGGVYDALDGGFYY